MGEGNGNTHHARSQVRLNPLHYYHSYLYLEWLRNGTGMIREYRLNSML